MADDPSGIPPIVARELQHAERLLGGAGADLLLLLPPAEEALVGGPVNCDGVVDGDLARLVAGRGSGGAGV